MAIFFLILNRIGKMRYTFSQNSIISFVSLRQDDFSENVSVSFKTTWYFQISHLTVILSGFCTKIGKMDDFVGYICHYMIY